MGGLNSYTGCLHPLELVPKLPHKKHSQDLSGKDLFEFKCMKYVEFCKLCLFRSGKLKTKFDSNVLCIFSYVAFFILAPIGTDTLFFKILGNSGPNFLPLHKR